MMDSLTATLVTTAMLTLLLGSAVQAATLDETKACYALGDLGVSVTAARDAGTPITTARAIVLNTHVNGGLQLHTLRLIDAVYQAPAVTGRQIRTLVEGQCFKQLASGPSAPPRPLHRTKRTEARTR